MSDDRNPKDPPDDSGSNPNLSNPDRLKEAAAKEPSLGPACLVLAILALAAFCSVCGIASWFVFSDQYPFAEKGITQQLIPWVESSQLAADDKASIVKQLNDLVPLLQARDR